MRKIQFGILAFIVIAVMGCSQETETKNLQSASMSQTQAKVNSEQDLFLIAHQLYKKQQYDESFKKMKPLAEQNNPKAQMMLAVMYERGHGVTQNYHLAKEWYEKSAQNGHAGSQTLVGEMYLVGLGTAKDEKKARFWLEKAAAQGEERAKILLNQLK